MHTNETTIDRSKSASRMDRFYIREVLGAVALGVAVFLVLGCQQVHRYEGSTEETGGVGADANGGLAWGRTNGRACRPGCEAAGPGRAQSTPSPSRIQGQTNVPPVAMFTTL